MNHKELMELNQKKQVALSWISNNICCDEVIFGEAFTRLKEIYKQIREIKMKEKSEDSGMVQQALKVFNNKKEDEKK